MADVFYVATDRDGITHDPSAPAWHLPLRAGSSFEPAEETASQEPRLVLYDASALLDNLDEYVFVAEPLGAVEVNNGVGSTDRARLVAQTPWASDVAARFALQCAAHATSDVTDVNLPDGVALHDVIEEAQRVLEEAADPSQHLGFVAALGAARRLRRRGEALGDVARELLADDVEKDVDALSDPAYAKVAAVVDAVSSAVEALRAYALPRYVRSREDVLDERSPDDVGAIPRVITTPWGPIAIGAEHLSPYEPSWVAARDAAARARDAMGERSAKGAADERAWQVELLSEMLRVR